MAMNAKPRMEVHKHGLAQLIAVTTMAMVFVMHTTHVEMTLIMMPTDTVFVTVKIRVLMTVQTTKTMTDSVMHRKLTVLDPLTIGALVMLRAVWAHSDAPITYQLNPS